MSITIYEIANTDTKLSGNEIRVKATTSGVPAGATDYRILLKIISADNLLVGSPFIDAIAPDADGNAFFDISGYVDQPADKDFTWPIPDLYGSRWHGYSDQVYDVNLQPGERYIDSDGNLQETFQSVFGTIFVVKGKLNPDFYAYLNTYGLTWFSYFCNAARWFSFMPITQYIHPNQPVKLWYKPPTTGLTFTFHAKAYYSDGNIKNYAGFPELYYDVMFEFEVGASGLGFPPIDGNAKLLKYEVWMDGTPSLEKRTFILNWDYHESTNYLFVDNGAGGIEVIWLSGAVKFAPAGEHTIAERPLTRSMTVKHRTKNIGNVRRTRRWIINSGYKNKEEMEALQVLLYSPAAWLVKQPANGSDSLAQYSIIPVIIKNPGFDLTDSVSDLDNIDIELEEAY